MSKKKKAGNILVYALMAMLILGLGGFGIANFSGGSSAIGSVGEREITAEEYYRALSQAVRAQQEQGMTGASFATLEAQGIPAQVRGQLAGTAALNNEADRLGLSVGDAAVAEQIRTSPSFAGIDGTFDREAYDFTLDRNGWSVGEFETTVRDELSRNILQAAVVTGVAPPETMVGLLTEWYGERRSFRWVSFDGASLDAPLPEPTDSELRAFYEADPEAYTLPEMKRITYARLTPEMIADQVEIDEAAVQQLYTERMDQFVVPERRLVERLVFGSSDEAVAAKQALDSGEKSFADLVADRGLTLADVDLGDATREDLGQAGDAVFGLAEPGIVGPYPSDLGPALFRMNGILAAHETSFEEAAGDLRHELALEEARRQIERDASDFDDRLAGGATLEDLAAETAMELGSLDYWSGSEAEIAGDEAFRAAADALTAEDFPEIVHLDDGSIAAMRLDETLPPRLQDLDAVRDRVVAGWTAAKRLDLLRARAGEAQAQLDVGGQLGDGGERVESAENVTRTNLVDSAPAALAEPVFAMKDGESRLVDDGDAVLLVQLDGIEKADPEAPEIIAFRQAITGQLTQGIAADLFLSYAQELTRSAGIHFNEAALNAVHSQLFR